MDEMKKVLYITYDGLTDPLGQSQVLPYLVELSKQGFRFTILSFEKKQRYQREQSTIRSIIENAGIEWVPLYFTANPPVLSKIYDRYRIWQKALRLHKKNQFDLIHCRSYVAAEVGLRLKKRFGTKFLFDMRGFWADEKVDNGQWNLNKPFFKRIYDHYKQKEKEFLLSADGIISLTQAAKDYLLSKDEYQHLSIEVIPCCADLNHFDYHRVDKNKSAELRKQLAIPANAKVVTYLGSVGGWYMTREMFSFFKLLLDRDADYHMLILTKDDPGKVKEEASEIGVPADKITVSYSLRKDLPLFLSLSRCSIFFIRNSFSKMASSPTKHAELMGMGIPVICNDIGDTGFIIKQTGTGLLVNKFDENSLAEAVQNISQIECIAPEKIRQGSMDFFDLKSGVEKYLYLYLKIEQPEKEKTSLSHA
jgi:glycosyltransferase involved in cell wall biosynthesis